MAFQLESWDKESAFIFCFTLALLSVTTNVKDEVVRICSTSGPSGQTVLQWLESCDSARGIFDIEKINSQPLEDEKDIFDPKVLSVLGNSARKGSALSAQVLCWIAAQSFR